MASESQPQRWTTLEAIIKRFEDDWRSGHRRPIEEYLSQEGDQRQTLLIELVHIDLEYSLKSGVPARVETYLSRYPELSSDRAVLVELVVAEFDFRRRGDPKVSIDEYLERFPDHADELRRHPVSTSLPDGHETELPVVLTQDTTKDGTGRPSRPPRKPSGELADGEGDDALPRIPGYRVLGVIGRGGMGLVYRARHETLGRDVAIKMPLRRHLADRTDRERFLREARSAARLRHPHVCPIHEIGDVEGQPYIVLGYVQGGTLRKWAERQRPSAKQAAEMVAKVARAVAYAHSRGVIHRDINPANVMVERETAEPVLTDFGLAKELSDDNVQVTQTGEVIGTPVYMSPEQAVGETGRVGPLSDVYGLGAILYELLCGRPPFLGNVTQVLRMILTADPVPPRKIVPRLHRDLETICLKALAKEPSARYTSAEELADDLDRFNAGEGIRARRESLAGKLARRVRRHPLTAALLIAFLLASFAAGVIFRNAAEARRLAAEKQELSDLGLAFESGLDSESWTESHVLEMEGLIDQLVEYDVVQANEAQRRLHDRLAEVTQAAIRQPRVEADDPTIARLLDVLEHRSPERTTLLREELANRLRLWRSVVQLRPPFEDVEAVLNAPDIEVQDEQLVRRSPPTDRPVPRKTLAERNTIPIACASEGNVRLVAEFGEGWDSAGEIGLLLNLPTEKASVIRSLAFSPNGKWIAAGANSVRVWEVSSGRLLMTHVPDEAGELSVAFDPTGSRLAVAHGVDGSVRFLDPQTGRESDRFDAHEGGVQCLSFSAQGGLLATGGGDSTSGEAKLWNTEDWSLIETFVGHTRPVGRIALSPDGRFLATASHDKTAILWDLQTKKPRYSTTRIHINWVQCVRFSPDGKSFVYPGYTLDKTPGVLAHPIGLMDLATGEVREVIHLNSGGICHLAFSPDGKTLASATVWGNSGIIRPIAFGGIHHDFPDVSRYGHGQYAILEFSPAGDLLAVACDGQVSLWRLSGWQRRAVLGSGTQVAFLLRSSPFDLPPAAGGRLTPPSMSEVRQMGGDLELVIAREGVTLRTELVASTLVPSQPLRLDARREGDRLTFQVGQLPPVTFRAMFPRRASGGSFGLRWPTGVPLKSLVASRQPLSSTPSLLERGDELYAQRRLAEALEAFQDQARISGISEVGQEARLKAGLCHLELGDEARAAELFEQVATEQGDRWPAIAAIRLWLVHLGHGRGEEAWDVFEMLSWRHGDSLDALKASIPQETRDDILSSYSQPLADRPDWVDRTPTRLRRAERALAVHQFFATAPADRLPVLEWTTLALHQSGELDRAVTIVDGLWESEHLPQGIEEARWLLHCGWLLRERGQPERALARVDLALADKPQKYGSREMFLLVERARLSAALGRWDEAERDIVDLFEHASGNYEAYAAASLIYGFLLERRGEADAAQRAWREASHRHWRMASHPNASPAPVDWYRSADSFLVSLILASLSGQLSDDDAEAILHRLTRTAMCYSPLVVATRKTALPHTPLRDMWLTPRGRQCARRIAFLDLSRAEYYRLPFALYGHEYLRQNAFSRQPTDEEDDVLWQAVHALLQAYCEEKIDLPQAISLGLAWKGGTGAMGWQGVSDALEPSLRAQAAFVLGHRYRRLGKPAEAAMFFGVAFNDAPTDSSLRRLAKAELNRSEP